jgi:hypothetical protein
MTETEYIITENTATYGWCLHRLGGKTRERAEQILAEEQAQYPDKELRIEECVSADCWWNQEDKWKYH